MVDPLLPLETPEPAETHVRRRHFLAVLGVAACSSNVTPTTDTSTEDAGFVDAEPKDSGGDFDTGAEDLPKASDAPAPEDVVMCTTGVRVLGVDDLAVGDYRLIQQRPSILIILSRDAEGYFAYSARCTHTGCTIPAPAGPTAFSNCPCHFSRFDAQGRVQAGSMARTDLVHYAVAICNGGVYVDRTAVVPITTRAAVG